MYKFLFFVFVVFILESCATEKIGNITSHPYKYHENSVQIKGKVVKTTNLFVVKTFNVADKSGEITVVSGINRTTLPAVGDKIKLRGTVYEAFKLGSMQKIVILEGVAPID